MTRLLDKKRKGLRFGSGRKMDLPRTSLLAAGMAAAHFHPKRHAQSGRFLRRRMADFYSATDMLFIMASLPQN